MTGTVLMAAVPPDSQVQPGWLGLVVVLALGIGTYLLWRSLNTQLGRVDFEPRPRDEEIDEGTGSVGSGPGGEPPAGGTEPGGPPDAEPGPSRRS